MSPTEVWWMIEARRPQKMYGSMPESLVAELYKEATAQEN